MNKDSKDAPFRLLFEQSPDPAWIIRGHRFIAANAAAVKALGYAELPDFMQIHPSELSPEFQPSGESSVSKADQMMDLVMKNGVHRFEWLHRRQDGSPLPVEVTLTVIEWEGEQATYCVWRDLSARKAIEDSLAFQMRRATVLLQLPRIAEQLDEVAFMQRGQEMAEDLTGSQIAFIHLVRDDQETIELIAWSRRTLEAYCHAPYSQHYPVSEAGIWADGVRQGRPVIVNDYALYAEKRGLPEGHSTLHRLISLPVIEHDKVVMLTGVGNKATDYTDLDVETVQLISNEIWRIVQRRRSEQALRESEARFRHVSSCISDIAYACSTQDGMNTLHWITGAVERITGYTPDEIKARGCWRFLVHEDDLGLFDRAVMGLEPASTGSCELRLRHKSGQLFWVASYVECIQSPGEPGCSHHYGALVDITNQRETQERLRLHAAVMESTRDAVLIANLEGRILAVNRACSEVTGYAENELLGRNPRMLKSGRHDALFYQKLWSRLVATGHWQGEIWNRRKNGEIYPEWLTVSTVYNAEQHPTHYVAVFTDISAIKQTEQHLERLAHYDSLTELPNRTLVQIRLEHALQRAGREGRRVGVLFVDLDRFKTVNDSLGHVAGDSLLKEVARRMRARLRASDTIGRLGGDEFLIVLESLRTAGDAAKVGRELLATLDAPFALMPGREVYIRASIGISVYPDDETSVDGLIRNADAAMYQVKDSGRNALAFYTKSLTEAAQDRLVMETRLRRALEQHEFVIGYQPLVSVRDSCLLGAEALLRWQPPGEPLVPPARFITLAEETGLIVPLGEWVLREVCWQAKRWQDAGLCLGQMAINLSVRQFQHPDLARIVRSILEETGFAPGAIELEITESCLLGSGDDIVASLREIKAMGLRLSIDDFGTGYSSLSYLKRLPLDRLKIDRSFIRDLPDDANDAAIASTIIAMAHALGLQALAEGVETEEQLEFLRKEGCDAYQGYLFSEPLPAEEFARRFLN